MMMPIRSKQIRVVRCMRGSTGLRRKARRILAGEKGQIFVSWTESKKIISYAKDEFVAIKALPIVRE